MKLVQFGPGATLRSIVTARRSAECQVCLGLCDTCYIERTHRKREMVLFDDSTLPSIASLAWISTDLNSPKVEAFSLAAHAVKVSGRLFHHGMTTGVFRRPEAMMMGR